MATASRRQPVAHPEFGIELTRLRETRGLGQSQLANAARIDASTVSRIEKGERGVSREVIDRLAEALSATPQEHVRLLRSAGLLPPVVASLLAEPDLGLLAAMFTRPDLDTATRGLLLDYVRLALAHARALGYEPPDPWEDMASGANTNEPPG